MPSRTFFVPARPGWPHLLCVVLAAASAGCVPADSAEIPGAFPGTAERRRDAIPLTEVAVSDPSLSLTRITGLDVDSRGRVYLGDWMQKRVTVLGPDGSVVRSFGRMGSGPGEFRSIRGVQVLPGDSLLVYDPGLSRVTVFAPDSTRPAYVVNLAASGPGQAPFHLWRTRANDAYVALFRPGFAFRGGQTEQVREDVVRVLELDGAPRGDRLLAFPSSSFLVAGTSVTPNPFGREGLVRTDSRDRLHFAWTDTLGVRTLDLSGRAPGGFAVAYRPPAVTERDIETELSALDDQRTTFERALRDSVSERHPAASGLVVDDADRVWLGLAGPRDSPTEWAAFSEEGAYLGSMLLPPGAVLWAIRRGSAYVERSDEMGVPRIEVLRLSRLP